MIKLLEFYIERQGRPDSKIALDMEGRWPSIPPGSIKASMIKDFGELVAYLASLETLSDEMQALLLDEDYGLEARFELLDSWFTDLEDIIGTKATAAATGAVTTTDYLMAYIKQLVTELQVVDGIVDNILTDTGMTLSAQITALVTDYLGHATHGLAQLETLVDSLETWLGDPSGHTLTTITAKIGDIARSLDLIIGARWDASGDLGTDIAQLLTYTDILDNATNGLANIKSLIDTLDGVADAILVDTGTTLPATLSTIDTVVDGIQTDLSNATDGLGALKTLIDAVQSDVTAIKAVTDAIPDAGALTALLADITTIKGYLDTEIAAILAAVDTEVAAILTDTGTTIPGTITTLQAAVDAIPTTAMRGTDNALLAANYVTERGTDNAALASTLEDAMQKATTPAYNQDTDSLEALRELLDTIEGYADLIDDATNGLAAIKAEVEGLAGAAMRGTDSAALASAWTAALATALGNYNATRAGYLDELAAANLPTDVAALNTLLSHGTYGLSALETLVDEVETYLKHGTYGLSALKTAIDAVGGYTHTDWKGNFNWDTSAYTTAETDISALFSTNLALTTRRKYSVKLDLTAVEADGSFDELYLAVKEKIDGTNYRAIDRKTVTKANIGATAEPGIIIDIPATSENIQITMQMKTALAGDATIYYAVVKEHLE